MTKLREARQAAGWSQTQLMHALAREAAQEGLAVPARDSLRIMVSRWENGHTQPDENYSRYLCAAYSSTPGELGLTTGGSQDCLATAQQAAAAMTLPQRVTPALLDYFERSLEEFARADNTLGGGPVLQLVEHQAALMDDLAGRAGTTDRAAALSLGFRYTELSGWLRQDSGDLDRAQQWSDRALGYAQELDDPQQLSYVLMRKSNIATDARQPARALSLAAAALRRDDCLSPRLRAVALRQQAVAFALAGEEAPCAAALEQALVEVGECEARRAAAEPTERDYAPYCTSAYLASEAGLCWLRLGSAAKAVQVLEQGLAAWPAHLTRDRGLCLSRLAAAHLANREIEQACATINDAIALAAATRSTRAFAELRPLRRQLAPWRRRPAVAEVVTALETMSGPVMTT